MQGDIEFLIEMIRRWLHGLAFSLAKHCAKVNRQCGTLKNQKPFAKGYTYQYFSGFYG